MHTRLLSLVVVVVLTACGGPVTLTPAPEPTTQRAMLYIQGEGLETCGPRPAARGQWVTFRPVRFDEVHGALVPVDADLEVMDAEGHRVVVEHTDNPVFDWSGQRTGVARTWRARFERTGSYVVTMALEDGGALSRELTVVEQAALRLGERGRQLVTKDAARECTQTLDEASLPTLALNQALLAWVVPVDAHGEVLLGDLQLAFEGSLSARPELPGTPFTPTVFEPTREGTNTVTITDVTLQQALDLSFTAAPDTARCAATD